MTDGGSNPEDQWESGNPDQSNAGPDITDQSEAILPDSSGQLEEIPPDSNGQSEAIPPESNPEEVENADGVENEATNENQSQAELHSQSEMKEETADPVDDQSEGYISESRDQQPEVVENDEDDMTQNDITDDKSAEDNISLKAVAQDNGNGFERGDDENGKETEEENENDRPGLQAEVTF